MVTELVWEATNFLSDVRSYNLLSDEELAKSIELINSSTADDAVVRMELKRVRNLAHKKMDEAESMMMDMLPCTLAKIWYELSAKYNLKLSNIKTDMIESNKQVFYDKKTGIVYKANDVSITA